MGVGGTHSGYALWACGGGCGRCMNMHFGQREDNVVLINSNSLS